MYARARLHLKAPALFKSVDWSVSSRTGIFWDLKSDDFSLVQSRLKSRREEGSEEPPTRLA